MNTTQALLVAMLSGGLIYAMTRQGAGALAPAPVAVPAVTGATPAQVQREAQAAAERAAKTTKASAALQGIGGAIAAIGGAIGARSDGADGTPAGRILGGLF